MGSREHTHGVSSEVWGRPSLTRHWSRAQKRPLLPRFPAGHGAPLAFGFVLPQGADKTPLVLSRGRMESYVHMKVLVHRWHVFFCLPLLLLSACTGQHGASPVYGGGEGSTWSKVPTVVFVTQQTDPRLQVAREAVDFWNRTFAELGTPFRLGPIVHTTDTVSVDDLQALSAQVVGRGGATALPEHIQRMPGDIIVVLSDGDFISFAVRSLSGAKVLVGIRSHRLYPLTLPNVARNVIAHELGHAIGLGHNDDPTTLMCGRPAPCRPAAFQSQTERFFPLTHTEKARLMTMYPPHWQSR